ncbi:MAG: protein phosphatase 2C domain-containing protein [Cylindrospermopsis raciborskii 1523720]|uniref:protein phosphatase 2C domain-containing protein n=1 Tax=Cylindrospermopsis raciborskii TaxID=77022 RepID=UPI002B46D8B2|nr:protein phosphatase 2C domain-containing protein [Cylindrospermopsis raciborskii]MEB3146843.1 protein phosphatase 2C domain-containing protein [Cylindrospermopsis raciborskii]
MSDYTNQLPLIIQENTCFHIQALPVEIISYLGQFTPDIYYFQVWIVGDAKPGLLRIGTTDGALNRELQLRTQLGDYQLISQVLLHTVVDNVVININNIHDIPGNIMDWEVLDVALTTTENQNPENTNTTIDSNQEVEYLEEEYYPEQEITTSVLSEKLLVLTYLPDENKTLETWLNNKPSLEESLLITSQICQVFRYLHQRGWCVINLVPKLMQIGTPGTPIKFFDLTNVFPVGELLNFGFIGDYCAPELAYCKYPVHETMSSYTVGALLYQIIHHKNLPSNPNQEIQINPIPQVYQLLKICLSYLPEERFTLEQFLKILVGTRQEMTIPKIYWDMASLSTVGLSINRLKNEDNYGIKYQNSGDRRTVILAGMADGMGGMSQGELASKLAIETVLESPLPSENHTKEECQEWLTSLFVQANEKVSAQVKDGGTTLSVIFAFSEQLMIGHVGDSRIYLLRQGEIQQLSQDHSLVALLFASGKITEEELSTHPDRNILTKSIGGKSRLSDGYIQDLRQTTSELTMRLEHEDIILLCSDGVWDLVSKNQLATNFITESNLQTAVNVTINQVLERGALDNATLLALRFLVTSNQGRW